MVFAVQCPNPNCRKLMLVEERDCANEIVCLLCKTSFQVEDRSLAQVDQPAPEPEDSEKD
jgi:hypothetical protein